MLLHVGFSITNRTAKVPACNRVALGSTADTSKQHKSNHSCMLHVLLLTDRVVLAQDFPADEPGVYYNVSRLGLVSARLRGVYQFTTDSRVDLEFKQLSLAIAGITLVKKVSPLARPCVYTYTYVRIVVACVHCLQWWCGCNNAALQGAPMRWRAADNTGCLVPAKNLAAVLAPGL